MQGWQWCVLVSVLVVEAVLITKDMGVLLVCNLPQSQDASTQTDVSESRVISGGSPSSGLPREETGDNDLGSDSSHAEEFQFGVGYKRDGCCIHNGGCVLSPLASGESGGMSG